MTLNSVGELVKAICVHWPNAKKNMLDSEGKISKAVADEWYKRIGFLDDARVDELFTEYLMDENVNKYPPTVGYFLGHKLQRKSHSYTAAEQRLQLRYKIITKERPLTAADKEKGFNRAYIVADLVDQEGRVYADPEDPEGIFYFNNNGYICKKGKDGREEVWFR